MHWIALLVGAFLAIATIGLDHALAAHADFVRARAGVLVVTLRTVATAASTRIHRAGLLLGSIVCAFRVWAVGVLQFTRAGRIGVMPRALAGGLMGEDRFGVQLAYGCVARTGVLHSVTHVSVLPVALRTLGVDASRRDQHRNRED
jgi:hypothetical protein